MQIPVGAEITFVRSDAAATIAGRQKVALRGEEMALRAATQRLIPDTKFGNAYALWRHGDELLLDIYDQCYPR